MLLCVAAVTGDAVGYWFGVHIGPVLYDRPQSRWFRREHLIKTREFYERYGGITIVLARFMPFARTFAPIVAGIAGMTYRRFALFNIAGGIGWIVSMTSIGYFLGQAIPGVEEYVEYIILAVVLISILPILIKIVSSKRKSTTSAP